jgi:hypothetical protein
MIILGIPSDLSVKINYKQMKYTITTTILFLGFLLLPFQVSIAQVSRGGMPYPVDIAASVTLRTSAGLSQIPFVEMPEFNKDELLSEDTLPGNRVGSIRFAHKFFVSITPENSGTLCTLADGTQIWRVGIRSSGAYSLNILFSDFNIPQGACIFVYSPDRSHILGAFTSENEQAGGFLPIAPVAGDEIIVEYIEPANAAFKGILKIGEVNHDYRGLRLLPGAIRPAECQVDVNCNNIHPAERRSTCLIIVDGTDYCSGNIVNNTSGDGTPYLLTASHCLFDGRNNFIPSKAATSVFFFNYETPYCYSDIEGSMEMSLAGATIQASETKRDMLLLRLNERPPADYRVYYAGWNATEEVSGSAYCFHHPGGSLKKISIEENTPYQASFTNGGMFWASSHWRVNRWETGITEGGSSGAGLFDSNNRIIGGLSGGYSDINCTNRGDDNFFMLSKNWIAEELQGSLSPWLDPEESGLLTLDGKDVEANPCVRLTNWQEGEFPEETSFAGGYAAGHNQFGITEFAERFSNEEGGKLFGVYFIPQKGRYVPEFPVKIQVYSGDVTPNELIYEQEVKITAAFYNRATGNFEENVRSSFYKKENYIRFPESVSVGKTFFVSFKITPSAEEQNAFALYHTTDRISGEKNTAFFKRNNAWFPFQENPVSSQPSSLLVEAVVSFDTSTDISETKSDDEPRTMISPNPTHNEITIRFAKNKQPLLLRMIDSFGRILFEDSDLKEEPYTLQTDDFCAKGVYFMQIMYADYTDIVKCIKQ